MLSKDQYKIVRDVLDSYLTNYQHIDGQLEMTDEEYYDLKLAFEDLTKLCQSDTLQD